MLTVYVNLLRTVLVVVKGNKCPKYLTKSLKRVEETKLQVKIFQSRLC